MSPVVLGYDATCGGLVACLGVGGFGFLASVVMGLDLNLVFDC